MKNFKKILSTIIIDYIYGLFTFLLSFIVGEYVYDIFTNFERFKLMHSFVNNLSFLLVFLIWLFFTFFVIKYNKKIIKKLK